MNKEATKLKFRDEFRSHHADAFQTWFERIAKVLHGDECFLSIRVTQGDGGLDGFVLKSGLVYQAFAPPSSITDAVMAQKVRSTFNRAKLTMDHALKGWTFIHNSADGKVGHYTAKALATIKDANPDVTIEAIGIDGLWDIIAKLSNSDLIKLFGNMESNNNVQSHVRTQLQRAKSLAHEDNHHQAFDILKQALAMAQIEKSEDLEIEILIDLCLISSHRHNLGDRSYYIKQLQSLENKIHKPILLAMTYHAKAAYWNECQDFPNEEMCLQSALALLTNLVNNKNALMQLCAVRSEYVHLLCQLGRMEEANELLKLVEAYAHSNPDCEDGEILNVALGAGIHWAACTDNADAVVERIKALESAATTAYRAVRTASQLVNIANHLSHQGIHLPAIAAAEASLRLAYKTPKGTQEKFLPGILYTEAATHFHAGQITHAMAMAKSLLDLPSTPETATIRLATAQLISVIARSSGDITDSVKFAESAVSSACDVESLAMAKMNLAVSLADHGQIERALESTENAYHLLGRRPDLPVRATIDMVGHIAQYSAQLGNEPKLEWAVSLLETLTCNNPKDDEFRLRFIKNIEFHTQLRNRILEIFPFHVGVPGISLEEIISEEVSHFEQSVTDKTNLPHQMISFKYRITSLHEANAATLAPILEWWKDSGQDSQAAALDFDYWGRGGFAQILRNLRAFPHTFKITLEVRSLVDIRRAIRLWGLYTDFLLLLWKGTTESGDFMHAVDSEYFGPWGKGYFVSFGDECRTKNTHRRRDIAYGYASWLPKNVIDFMCSEVRGLIATGRLLIVPASAIGCVSPGFGVMEQLLSEAACAILRNARIATGGVSIRGTALFTRHAI